MRAALLPLMFVYALSAPPALAQGWKTFPNPGPDFQLGHAAIDGSDIYAEGNFTRWYPGTQTGTFTGTGYSRLERWDGQRWNVLMDSAQGTTRALRIVGGKPYIAFNDEHLRESGDKRHSVIKAWDGKAWSTLAVSPVDDAEIVDFIPLGDKLIAAVDRGVWSWDGKVWTALGDPGFYPYLLLAHGDTVYAGGSSPADDASRLGRYAAGAWTPMNLVENSHVYGLAWWDGKLAVGGGIWKGYDGADSGTAFLGTWNGSALEEIPLPLARKFSRVGALDTCDGVLYAGIETVSHGWDLPGALYRAKAGTLSEVTGWIGGSALNNGMSFNSLASQGGRLVAAGGFAGKDGKRMQSIAVLANGDWSALGGDPVLSGPSSGGLLAPYPNGVCALGDQTFTGGSTSEGLDCWDGKAWTPMAGWKNRITRERYPALPDYSVFRWDGGRLLISGDFDSLGNQAIKSLAYREGDAWKPFGAGPPGAVETIRTWKDTLFAAISSHPDASTWHYALCKWDGAAWTTITPPASFGNNSILGLAEFGGELWMAGNDQKGKLSLTAWDGKVWRDALGPAAAGKPALQFQGIQAAGGRLYVHTRDDSTSIFHQWDGKAWSEIGRANYTLCYMLASTTQIYVYGTFNRIGGKAIDAFARWDGSSWFKVGLGSGLEFLSCEGGASGQDQLYLYATYLDDQGRFGNGLIAWDTRDDVAGIRAPRGKGQAPRWRILPGGTLASPEGDWHRIDGRRRAGLGRK